MVAARCRAIEEAATSGSASSLNDTSFINRLADALAHPFKVGFSESMSVVFLTAAAIMVVGLVVISFLPELPLRRYSVVQQRAQEDAATAAATPAAPAPS
jgi:hypothetical protein